MVRVLRNGNVIYKGKIDSLRHFKEEVKEAKNGTECGISFENFDTMEEGDVIQTLKTKQVPYTLNDLEQLRAHDNNAGNEEEYYEED